MRTIIDYSKYRKTSIALLLIFILLILLPKLLNRCMEPGLLNYRIMPIIWGCFLLIFLRFIPRVHPIGRISKQENIYLESIICAALLTGIQFLAGSMIGEMGESPYILTPKGIFNNLLYVFPPLFMREFIRSYILGTFCVRTNIKAFIMVTAIMTLLSVNYTSMLMTENLEDIAVFLAKEFGPLLCQNIVLSYLALYGGAAASLSYLCVITLFHWTSPILPVLNWLAEGSIGILVPIFYLMFIVKKYETQAYHSKIEKVKVSDAIQWVFTAAFSIGLIWFVIGVFPYIPSVIATGSMEPMIKPGDVIILQQIRSEEQVRALKEGDIIQFKRGELLITHRITEIESDKNQNLTFHTKGDNNSVEDIQTVDPNDVKGLYIYNIPKLGYPTLLIKGQKENADDVTF